MSTTTGISAAIRRLPAEERWNLLHEFADELWSDWDARIESDLSSGGLDDFITQARGARPPLP
ncbi:MAG: hypothetical protein V4726_15985 [Verrucomicrobiota bacterium]